MRVQVNEAWGDDKTISIDDLGSVMRLQAADFRNPAIFITNVGAVARQSCPIDDHSPLDDEVKCWHKHSSFGNLAQASELFAN
jgi:hypothetical protein